MVTRAERVATAADLEPEPDGAVQGGDGALGHVGGPERPPAGGGGSGGWGQLQGLIGLRTGTPSNHGVTPGSRIDSKRNRYGVPRSRIICHPRKKASSRLASL